MLTTNRLLLLGVAGLMLGVGAAAWWLLRPPVIAPVAEPPWLAEDARAGLSFLHDAGPVGDYFMPQIMGSGVALLDFDGDGLLDVYLLHHGGPAGKKNQLFKQLPDGTFKDVSHGSGLDVAGFNTGVAVGDVNNDGRPDVVVTSFGGVRLFVNKGDGTFRDETESSGLVNLGWGTSAAFFDFDRDGWLDLVVVSYCAYDGSTPCYNAVSSRDYCHPRQFSGQAARLFRNLGAPKAGKVRFDDVSDRSGLGKRPAPGLGVVCADFDGDGWPDVFVANDGKPNHLWINQRDGTFAEEAAARGLAFDGMGRSPANMGVAPGDVDGDGLLDLFVTHLTDETHTLWRQGPPGHFRDATNRRGLAPAGSRGTGFGTALIDLDNDGGLDALAVNGRIAAGKPSTSGRLGAHYARYAERNQLFANDGRGFFRDRSAHEPTFADVPGVFRGLAAGDLRNRGVIDVVVTEVAGPARLYRNAVPKPGNWLVVRAIDPALKRDAYGAEISVEAGGRVWRRWINPGSSYLSSSDPRAHFGLGATERVDAISVRWPGGDVERFGGRDVNAHVTLSRGDSKR